MADRRIGQPIDMGDGRMFWPLDPRASEVGILDIAGSLSRICRFGGRCREFYSVAQHSLLVMDIVQEVYGRCDWLVHALLHDAAEAYVGDIVTPLKRDIVFVPDDEVSLPFELVEQRIMAAIQSKLGLRAPSDDAVQAIKHADRIALATEARDLMGDPDWARIEEPMPRAVEPMASDVAMRAFLRAFAGHRFRRGLLHGVQGDPATGRDSSPHETGRAAAPSPGAQS